MNKKRVPSVSEIEDALEAAGQAKVLEAFRNALARGDKIKAAKIAMQAGIPDS